MLNSLLNTDVIKTLFLQVPYPELPEKLPDEESTGKDMVRFVKQMHLNLNDLKRIPHAWNKHLTITNKTSSSVKPMVWRQVALTLNTEPSRWS